MARLGGDEFAVLLPDTSEAGAQAVVAALLERLRQPFSLGEHVVNIDASIGTAIYPQQASSSATLLAAADSAMYSAKRTRTTDRRTLAT